MRLHLAHDWFLCADSVCPLQSMFVSRATWQWLRDDLNHIACMSNMHSLINGTLATVLIARFSNEHPYMTRIMSEHSDQFSLFLTLSSVRYLLCPNFLFSFWFLRKSNPLLEVNVQTMMCESLSSKLKALMFPLCLYFDMNNVKRKLNVYRLIHCYS